MSDEDHWACLKLNTVRQFEAYKEAERQWKDCLGNCNNLFPPVRLAPNDITIIAELLSDVGFTEADVTHFVAALQAPQTCSVQEGGIIRLGGYQ